MQEADPINRPRTARLRYALGWLCLVAAGARAENVITSASVSLEAAQRAAAESVRKCQTDGYRVSATVVDRAGVAVATLRADGGPVRTRWTAADARLTRPRAYAKPLRSWQVSRQARRSCGGWTA